MAKIYAGESYFPKKFKSARNASRKSYSAHHHSLHFLYFMLYSKGHTSYPQYVLDSYIGHDVLYLQTRIAIVLVSKVKTIVKSSSSLHNLKVFLQHRGPDLQPVLIFLYLICPFECPLYFENILFEHCIKFSFTPMCQMIHVLENSQSFLKFTQKKLL